MNFGTAISRCFNRYATFAGRARRAEYWYFVLFTWLGGVIASILDAFTGVASAVGVLNGIFSLLIILPSLAVSVRRMHDLDRSGWWLLAPSAGIVTAGLGAGLDNAPVLVIGGLAALGLCVYFVILVCSRGTAGPNRYGEDPLALG